MHPKASIQVGKHQSKSRSTPNVEETPEERATRKANAALEAEIKAAKHEAKHPKKTTKTEHHGIVYALIARHKAAIKKKDEERAALRRGLGTLPEGDAASTAHSSSSNSLIHSAEVVDALEVVDTEIQTVSTLSNITRSIIVPPRFAGRPPLVQLSPISSTSTETTTTTTADENGEMSEESKAEKQLAKDTAKEKKQGEHLDKHVKAQLQRQRIHQKAISVLKGTWTFVKTPVGVLAAIYGFLVVFSGAGLVICLAGWVPGNKDLQVEAFSQSTNALFTIPGVGLIPWRLRDTYIISRICHYRNRSNDLRKKRGLPPLQNANDLAFEAGLIPAPLLAPSSDSAQKEDTSASDSATGNAAETSQSEGGVEYMSVLPALSTSDIPMEPVSQEHEHMLSPHEAATLRDLQERFARNCTWYRPNETPTHYAYPIGRAVTVTVFVDLNSLFQCLMCGFMWGYATHYKDRPAWSTGSFLPLSFVSGIIAAVVIWIGGKKTHKKKEVIERLKVAFEEEKSAEA